MQTGWDHNKQSCVSSIFYIYFKTCLQVRLYQAHNTTHIIYYINMIKIKISLNYDLGVLCFHFLLVG